MSIRPIDMQVVLPRLEQNHSAKQTTVSKLDNELIANQMIQNRENLQKSKQVNKLNESNETIKITKDNQKKEQGNKKDEKENKDGKEHVPFDMSI